MRRRARFAGVANDPGGARAILPVLDWLQSQGHPVAVLTSGPATKIARHEFASLPLIALRDSASRKACTGLLKSWGVEVLLSASGAYNRIEHTARRAAKNKGIPVVALLDTWWFYRKRFERTFGRGEPESSWPDHICAIDEKTKSDLQQLGYPPEAITVTGAPNLEKTLQLTRGASRRGKSLRRRLGIDPTTPCVVFFSEPTQESRRYSPVRTKHAAGDPDEPSGLDCQPLDMAKLVLASMEQARRSNQRVTMMVKPHPAEDPNALHRWVASVKSRRVDVIFCPDADRVELFALGDAFFGLTSISLLEAALTGKPVVSVQVGKHQSPAGLGSDDCCVSNHVGASAAAYSKRQLQDYVRRWLEGDFLSRNGKTVVLTRNATRKVARVLKSVAKKRGVSSLRPCHAKSSRTG